MERGRGQSTGTWLGCRNSPFGRVSGPRKNPGPAGAGVVGVAPGELGFAPFIFPSGPLPGHFTSLVCMSEELRLSPRISGT